MRTTPQDMAACREWTARHLADPPDLPTAFICGNEAIAGIPPGWGPVRHRRLIDARIAETVFEGRDERTGLAVRVEVTEYCDYPMVEWIGWMTSIASQPTPMLRDIQAVDGEFAGRGPVLWHCNVDMAGREAYTPVKTPLAAGQAMSFAASGGKSCRLAFPYFRLMFDGGGVSIAVGWPGQWAASFKPSGEGVRVRAGQEHHPLSAAARRDDPHAANDAAVLDRRRRLGRRPQEPPSLGFSEGETDAVVRHRAILPTPTYSTPSGSARRTDRRGVPTSFRPVGETGRFAGWFSHVVP
jgi:hypothetical protein